VNVPQPEHRELSREEAEDLVHEAFACEREIKANIATIHADTWTLAEHVYEFHELRGWTLVGYETLEKFLAQPEVGMSRTSFFRLFQTWRDLVEVRKVAPERLSEIEPSKVYEVRPAIMSGKVSPDDALDDAQALGFRDLREKYRLKSPGAGTSLAAEEEPVRTRCPACGGWTRTAPVLSGREDGVING
jgi:hypothetical protein